MNILLGCCLAVFLSLSADNGNPHAPNARHPAEIARIMKLLPKIETTDPDKVKEMLGLPKDHEGGSISTGYSTLVWEKLAPGYRFVLCYSVVPKDGKVTWIVSEASFSAQKKPGFPPDEYHTIYPYYSSKGLVRK